MKSKGGQSGCWLVKQEPESYSWENFTGEGGTAWTGVRNFQARNNLRLMRKGDCVFFYHSGKAREVVGEAKVAREAYADPTAEEGDWSAVDLKPARKLERPVSLAQIKANPKLRKMALVRNSRLSVMPLTREEFGEIQRMSSREAM